ncbi:hypothetical protein [Chondromyces apiculatus]|uniref:Uncharacterized protein n=1 Tax=Chondromyces apiculatus DSM 436 TaxID=1192034 RepID=A0A017TJ75_9BACT|nr:hypothetical protein [Chondromyces apiculatus]EYF08666.1 Hypothetical protein CAP_2527 [Chondromyces apiculatus DSM 436]
MVGVCSFKQRGEHGAMVFYKGHPSPKKHLVELCDLVEGTWKDGGGAAR